MKNTLLFLAFFALSAFASEAFTHDGFFLSLTAGLGYGSFNNKMDYGYLYNPELTSEGAQTEAGMKIGGAIINNFILHATMSVNILHADMEDSDGNKFSHDGFKIFMFGAGFTYFFPLFGNTYARASAGISNYKVTRDNKDYNFLNLNKGFAFNAALGKEWWVSQNIGFGIALSYTHTSATGKYDGANQDGTTNTFSVVWSLTIN